MIHIPTFDKSLHENLEQAGFAVIPSFISPEQGNELQEFFFNNLSASNVDVPFFTTHWSNNNDYRKSVNSFVTNNVKPNLDKYFSDYKCLFGYYLFKKPSQAGGVFMHKDWTLIDEERFVGYTIWIPLVDITSKNGCFEVVPGSHLNSLPRGSNLPQEYPEVTEKDFKPLPVHAGDAIIFDHRLLHSSPPNLSDTDRLSVGLIIVPESAVPIHYFYQPETGETRKYEVGDDFLVKSFYDYKKLEPADYILNIITDSEKQAKSTL
jgi:hypothetical protein